jgi:hypothetical protein
MRRRGPTAVIVLGYHEFDSAGRHGISAICRAGVRRARRLAVEVSPAAVVFTGWSSRGGPSEADQMIAIWDGPPTVAVLREPCAIDTSENATRSLAVLRSFGHFERAIVVCSIRHALRVPFFFHPLFAQDQISVRYAFVWRPFPGPRIWCDELGGITRMFGDREQSRRALARGEHEPPRD